MQYAPHIRRTNSLAPSLRTPNDTPLTRCMTTYYSTAIDSAFLQTIERHEKRSSPYITMIVIISATAKHEQLLLPTTSGLVLRMMSIHTSDHAIHVHERNQRHRLQQDFSIRFPYL